MSRRIHILLLLYIQFCFVSSTLGQDPQFPEPFISGIELFAGPGLSFLRGNPSVDNNSVVSRSLKLGYSYGFDLSHSVNEKFQIKGLLFFESKGSIAEHNALYLDEATQTYKTGKTKEEYIYDYYTFSPIVIYSRNKKYVKIGLGPYASYLETNS